MKREFRRKRIAVLVPGGVGNPASGMHIPVLYNLVQLLAETDDVVVFSLATPDWDTPEGTCGNARVRFLPVHHQRGAAKKLWLLVKACRIEHGRQPFDIVHGFWAIPCGVAAVLLGMMFSIPRIVSFLGGETASLPGLRYGNMLRSSTRKVTLWVAGQASVLTTLTHHQAEELRTHGCERIDVHVIPFGADERIFTPVEKKISTRPLRLLHVGNIHPLKDHITMLRTFQTVVQSVDARLRIIGADGSGGEIQRRASEMGLKVEFTGHVPHNELPEHYHWAHILVHTSMHEAQAVVVAEAASCGVLVAGTRTGLLADLGEDVAIVAGIGDHQTLARNILNIVADAKRYETLRQAGLRWAMDHSFAWTARQYTHVYDNVLVEKKARP